MRTVPSLFCLLLLLLPGTASSHYVEAFWSRLDGSPIPLDAYLVLGPGETAALDVVVTDEFDALGTSAVGISLDFTNSLLFATSVDMCPDGGLGNPVPGFCSSALLQPLITPTIDNANGRIRRLAALTFEPSPFPGPFALARVEFTALATGCAQVEPGLFEPAYDVILDANSAPVLLNEFFLAEAGVSIEPGLIAYWKMDGNGQDSSGTCNPLSGSVNGAVPTAGFEGMLDTALLFDGVDDWVDLFSGSLLKPDLPVTIAAYVLSDCPPATNCWIFENDAFPGRYYGVSLAVSDGGLYAQYGDGSGANSTSRRSATTFTILSSGVWQHVAVVIAGPTDFRFYLDGVRVDSGQVILGGTGGAMAYGGGNAQIGLDNGVFGAPFEGALDDVRFYRRALSESEIIALPEPGVCLALGSGLALLRLLARRRTSG